MMRLLLSLLLVTLLMTGCGFTPVFGNFTKNGQVYTDEALSYVSIENIPDREGQHLRNLLMDRFYGNSGKGTYVSHTLSVSDLKERSTDLDITKSSDATRAQLRLNAVISLTDKKTGKIVLNRKISAITSYNILPSEFATRITEEDARKNALEDLARQTELYVSLYFRRADKKTQ